MGRKKQPDNTIAQILQVAQRLFLEKGYEQTTMQDIVDHTDGLSRGAIYHHFKSKDEIISAVAKGLRHEGYGSDDQEDCKRPALEKLRNRWIHFFQSFVEGNILLSSASLLKNPKYLAIQLNECIDYRIPSLCSLIEEGNRDGSMKVESVEATAEMIGLLIHTWCIPAFFPGSAIQAIERFTLLCTQCEALGVPVMNDDLLAAYYLYAEKYAGQQTG